MNAVQILTSLGFTGSSVVNDSKGKVCVKIWTSRGWSYEKFDKAKLEDEITAWARGKEPGTWP